MVEPKDARQTSEGRLYTWRGQDFVSVTNVIGVLHKPALVPAARKVQAETILDNLDYYASLIESKGFDKARMQASRDAKAVWDKKTEQGTAVHEAIEHMVAGRFDQIGSELDPWMKHLDRWLLENTPHILYSEVTVYSRTCPAGFYAGTIDWIMEIDRGEDGSEVIAVDTKSGASVWPEVALQLSAYSSADFIGRDGEELPLPPINRCAVLHLTDKDCELIPVRTGPDVFAAFCSLRRVWDWVFDTSKTVLP